MRSLAPIARIAPRISRAPTVSSVQPLRTIRTLSIRTSIATSHTRPTLAVMTVDTKRHASHRPNVTKENPVST